MKSEIETIYESIKAFNRDYTEKMELWNHEFKLRNTTENGFEIYFPRDIFFYFLIFMALVFLIPLVISTLMSLHSLWVDPSESFMYFFDYFLVTVRLFFIKNLCSFIKGAYRTVTYCEETQEFRVESRAYDLFLKKTMVFKLKDVEGLEIKPKRVGDLMPSGTFTCVEKYFEVSFKLKDENNLVLFPFVPTIQEARTLVRRITRNTGIQLMTSVCSLYK